ncbi:class I SAM-dependent methyltransferase [Georgenia subflava]|uniref:Methyltransferase domain-containing protein n=1 Tax=Georgenia subflava TaxID=1622177 RepID=A0A6N7EIA5_9MICO|nr:class I SAM-dependent methyltransferase [Georgenia subflava]MPV37869.1 methyltransferase domain-containing protein [Georgenia subflava]
MNGLGTQPPGYAPGPPPARAEVPVLPSTAAARSELIRPLRGTVVEIGPGAGVNLHHFHRDVRWVGFEPDGGLHPAIRDEAARLGRQVDVRAGRAEELDLPDGGADAAVGTLVLCSVDDVTRSLAEVRRVLRPGGTYVFVEHVAAPRGTWTRRGQAVWSRLAPDGCQSDRETGLEILRAGFDDVRLERAAMPGPLGTRVPLILGRARR